MTQRERYLAIGVGVVVAILTANVGFKKITGTLAMKETRLENAQKELSELNSTIDSGMRAATRIQRLEKRALPSQEEEADAQYTSWLYALSKDVGLTKVNIAPAGKPRKVVPPGARANAQAAYTVHEYRLDAECQTESLVDLLAKYYDRDYLQRIKALKISPAKQNSVVNVELTSEVVSLPKNKDKKEPSLEPSGRLAMSIDEYKQKVLDRNLFSPPNKPPTFTTGRSHTATIGSQPWRLELDAKDPDGHNVKYELVTERDKLPKDLTFRGREISWRPAEKTTQEIEVRAIDDGWPRKSTVLKLSLKAEDAPPPKVETPPATIDPAKHAFLTGLVSGRAGAQGWIRSKAEGISIDIVEGTEINVGSVKAKVIKINLREDHVELETDGSRWIADMDTSLAEAYAKSRID